MKQVQDVLTVPSQALTTTGGKTYVTVSDGSSTKKTAVTVGETYGMSTEITKGLVAGDVVEIPTVGRARTGVSTSTGGNEQQRGGDGGFPGGGTPPGGGAGGFPGGNQ